MPSIKVYYPGRNNDQARHPTTWWSQPLVLISATIGVGLLSLTLWVRPQEDVSTDPTVVLHQEIMQIASEVSLLQEQTRTASSAATVEKVIRDELLMQKPGEYVVQLPPLPSPSPVVVEATPTPSNWRQWREVLF